ncbi:MAG: galactose mutarotase [Cyclobacteriaceae bacterium]|nr:galactose mutarotase [Cyclobacteriaceae bacterium]
MTTLKLSSLLVIFTFLFACQPQKKSDEQPLVSSPFKITTTNFGVLPEGDSVTKYTFANSNGLEVSIINYGGIVTNINFPDTSGKVEDLVLGFDHLEGYLKESPYFGAIVGRYGNRIAQGKFTLNGQAYNLATNNNKNHLHGGLKGFDKVLWDATPFESADGAGLKLHYLSKDMEEGYPGNLDVNVTYTIKNDNTIEIDYKATTDKPTIVNLTQHSYFNLTGDVKRDILNHEVMILADSLIPVDAGLIPTGEMMSVTETPFDFRQVTPVGDRIDEQDEQLSLGGGYDHCWVLDKTTPNALEWVVKAMDPESGRVFELATTEPGVQFYSGNFLDGSITGKYKTAYQHRYGLCFEPEHFPDSPNQANFPSVVLNPDEEYHTTTVWRFSIVE